MMTSTKYDEQIARLTAHPEEIEYEWLLCEGLFNIIGDIARDDNPGCPTVIRLNVHPFPRKAYINGVYNHCLTDRILKDESIPKSYKDIKPEHLPAFLKLRLEIDSLEEEAQKQKENETEIPVDIKGA